MCARKNTPYPVAQIVTQVKFDTCPLKSTKAQYTYKAIIPLQAKMIMCARKNTPYPVAQIVTQVKFDTCNSKFDHNLSYSSKNSPRN